MEKIILYKEIYPGIQVYNDEEYCSGKTWACAYLSRGENSCNLFRYSDEDEYIYDAPLPLTMTVVDGYKNCIKCDACKLAFEKSTNR